MHRFFFAVLVVLGGLSLSACMDQKTVLQALIPKEDDSMARQFIESVRTGNYDGAKLHLDSSLRVDQLDQALHQVHDLMAKGEPFEIETVGYNINSISGKRRSDLSYQLHFHDSWVGGDVVIDTQNDSPTIAGFHFRQIPGSLEELNRFSLRGKSMVHYIILACCVGIPCLIVYTIVVCARTRLRRKWLWILFILFGLGQVQLNWTTGALGLKPLSIVLLGSGYHASGPYAPWILEFGLPVGALVFLIKRKKLIKPPVLKAN